MKINMSGVCTSTKGDESKSSGNRSRDRQSRSSHELKSAERSGCDERCVRVEYSGWCRSVQASDEENRAYLHGVRDTFQGGPHWDHDTMYSALCKDELVSLLKQYEERCLRNLKYHSRARGDREEFCRVCEKRLRSIEEFVGICQYRPSETQKKEAEHSAMKAARHLLETEFNAEVLQKDKVMVIRVAKLAQLTFEHSKSVARYLRDVVMQWTEVGLSDEVMLNREGFGTLLRRK